MDHDEVQKALSRWRSGEFHEARCFLLDLSGRHLRATLERAAWYEHQFTDVLPDELVPNHVSATELVLLSFDGLAFASVGVVRRSHEVATGQRRLAFEHLTGIGGLSIQELVDAVPPGTKLRELISPLGFGKPLEGVDLHAAVEALFLLRPELGLHVTVYWSSVNLTVG